MFLSSIYKRNPHFVSSSQYSGKTTSPENGRVVENANGTHHGAPSPPIHGGPLRLPHAPLHLLRRHRRGGNPRPWRLRRRLRRPAEEPPRSQVLQVQFLLRGDFPTARILVSDEGEGRPELAGVPDSSEERGVLQRHIRVGRWPAVAGAVGAAVEGEIEVEFVVGAEFRGAEPSPTGYRWWRGIIILCF